MKSTAIRTNKCFESIEAVIKASGLRDGQTISFHHHFRNGDAIVNQVMAVIAKLGIRDLTIAASSLSDIHSPLIEYIEIGVVKRIETSGLRGELANRISNGLMAEPIVFRSHGNRAEAIASGEIVIDVAFLGVPACDDMGNANGFNRDGDNAAACGSLGYAMVDAQHAKFVALLTQHLVPYPNTPAAIQQNQVDAIVRLECIGDPKGISSGATRYSTNPKELKIAKLACDVMVASGYFKEGFSFQTGTGGASLAVTRFLKEHMNRQGIKASYALGGITSQIVKLHEEGYVHKLLDVQSFDLDAVRSAQVNPYHQVVDAQFYATPALMGGAVNRLDMVVLSALEIDVNFNVNVLTGSDGIIRGAVGGHPDTAASAQLSIIVAPLVRGRMPSILSRVNTIVTSGDTVDVLVTDQGIAVNPQREDLIRQLRGAGLPLCDIADLKAKAEAITGVPASIQYTNRAVGLVKHRMGHTLDTIYQVAR